MLRLAAAVLAAGVALSAAQRPTDDNAFPRTKSFGRATVQYNDSKVQAVAIYEQLAAKCPREPRYRAELANSSTMATPTNHRTISRNSIAAPSDWRKIFPGRWATQRALFWIVPFTSSTRCSSRSFPEPGISRSTTENPPPA